MGRILYARPRSKALPTSRRLDLATHLVAPIQALAQGWLETVACVPALRRVRACAVARFNSFSFPPVSLSLRESCIRQIRLCSLGGGRRPAPHGAPPPPRQSRSGHADT